MADAGEFLRTRGEIDLKTEGEAVARSIYSSEGLDGATNVMLADFLSDIIDLKADPVAMQRAFHVLAVLCSMHKRYRMKVIQHLGCHKVVDIILLQKTSEIVQRKAMFFVNTLAMDEQARTTLVTGGMAKVIVDVMEALSTNKDVIERATVALSNLSLVGHEGKVLIGREGGVRGATFAARSYDTNLSITLACLVCIRNLTTDCVENVGIAASECVTAIAFSASRRNQRNLSLQGQVSVVVANLVKHDDVVRQKVAASTQDLETILNLFKNATGSRNVTENVLELLKVLLDRNNTAIEYVCERGLIETLKGQFEGFSDSPRFVENACAVLRALGFKPEPREIMRESGIFEDIVRGLNDFSEDAKVVEQSMCAISNACVLNTDNQENLGMQGAVEATVQAMEKHRENPVLQDYGCRTLRNLADNCEFNIRLEGDCGGINAATLAILGFPKNVGLAEQACAALLNMARSEQNAIRMLEQDVQDIVNQALITIDNEGFQKQASRLMSVLERPLTSEAAPVRSESSFARSITRSITATGLRRSASGQGSVNQKSFSRRMTRMRSKSIMRRDSDGGEEEEPPSKDEGGMILKISKSMRLKKQGD